MTVGCAGEVPAAACERLRESAGQNPQYFFWSDGPAAEVQLSTSASPDGQPVGTWVYAVAAPFYTLDDEVSSADLRATWAGTSAGPFVQHPLLVTTDTLRVLTALWGAPAGTAVGTAEPADLLDQAIQSNGWAILPFDELEPRWKVLRVDGVSLLDRGVVTEATTEGATTEGATTEGATTEGRPYGLVVPLFLHTNRPDTLAFLPTAFANRDEERMSVVVMTGVTALTRATARTMEERGVTFPAQDIGDWLRQADLTHVSNEVSFTPDCPVPPPQETMAFCSHERYIELLDAVGVDIVELTGNHNNDYGRAANLHTLDLFRQRGWRWFGGGENLAEATRPLTVTLGPNRLAFLGCNTFDPAGSIALATEDSPGANPCNPAYFPEAWAQFLARVTALRDAGWLPIVTVQAYETYEYFPTAGQEEQFRAIAEAGAVVVQGSQAHQPQGFDFHAGAFIHYGLGNLFFDQMWSLGTRQEFIDRLIFYDGRLLSVELRTAMLEDYARPRPMTAAERQELLEATFAVSADE